MKYIITFFVILNLTIVHALELREVVWKFNAQTLQSCIENLNPSGLSCSIPINEVEGFNKTINDDVKLIAKRGGCSITLNVFSDELKVSFNGVTGATPCVYELDHFKNPDNEFLKEIENFEITLTGY